VPNLYDGDHLLDDCRLIRERWGAPDVRRIEGFLDELGGNEDALWQLMRRLHVRDDERPFFKSRAIECMLVERYSMYRVRPLRAVSGYRVLYAVDFEHDDVYVLAIVKKKRRTDPDYDQRYYYDYERTHPISMRVLAEYDAIGLPKIRG
jgi:hypothetical protein